METSFTGETPAEGNIGKGKDIDEISRIDNLEPAIKCWLQEVFQVVTLKDLAALSVDQVFSRLEAEGQEVTHGEVERWIAQAKELTAEETSWQTFATFVVSLQSQPVGEQINQRTIAYYVEADQRIIWPGIESNGVCALILDQLKSESQAQIDTQAPVAADSIAERASKATAEMSLEVNHTPELADEFADLNREETVDNQGPGLNKEKQVLESEPIVPSPMESKANESSESTPDESSTTGDPASELTSEHPSDSDQADEILESTNEIIEPPFEHTLEPVTHPGSPELAAEDEVAFDRKSLPQVEIGEPVTLKITQLKVYQPLTPNKASVSGAKTEKIMVFDTAKRLFSGELPKEKPFDFEITFQLSGARVAELTKQSLTYHAEVYGQNRKTRKKLALGQTPAGKLVDGELTYSCRLPAVTLPESGSYRLQVITQLDGASVSPDFWELPFVQVA